MDKKEVFALIDKNEARVIDLWKHITQIESPSDCFKGVAELASHLDTYASAMGFETKKHEFSGAGPSLVIRTEKGRLPAVALAAHIDTVHPVGSFGDELFEVKGDKVYGPGVYDCKGGVAVAFLVAMALTQAGYRDRQIKILLNGDEEAAHSFSKGESTRIFQQEIPGCACAFNCESAVESGDVFIQRKGGGIAEITVNGVEAHSGNAPRLGASAIAEAARQIVAIEGLNDLDAGLLCNCGIINGGTSANVIPGKCVYQVALRFKRNTEYEDQIRNIEEIVLASEDDRITTDLEMIGMFKAMEPLEKTEPLLELYQDACTELGFERPLGIRSNGCSDASFISALGVPVLCGVGIMGDYNHSLREFAYLSSLSEQAKKIVSVILSLPDDF